MKPTILFLSTIVFTSSLSAAEVDFSRQVAPLLVAKCFSCHNEREQQGGLDLSSRKAAFAGGDSGEVISPGNSAESYLWDRIAGDEMPPKHPLSADSRRIIKDWIDQGAKWEGNRIDPFAFSTDQRAGYDWWSLQPLQQPALPTDFQDQHPIDAFVRHRLKTHDLEPSPKTDRRTLIRRVSFSLLGFSPTSEEVNEFENETEEDAYEKLIDRMLDSPHYGERWARHWLDLARFGESQGFERDKLREHAWPYRDWVIQALNDDMPYNQFARLQIAGDVLNSEKSAAIPATGFLVAGAYDEVGQKQQSLTMRAVVRQDEMEDYIGTVCQTFLGLTVNCARCHDHKFDPVTQEEYYQIAAALAGVRPGERRYQTAEMKAELQAASQRKAEVEGQIKNLLDPIRADIQEEGQEIVSLPEPIGRWTFEEDAHDVTGTSKSELHGGARIENGQLVLDGKDDYLSTTPLPRPLLEKTLEAWVQLSTLEQRGGGVLSVQSTDGNVFDAIVFGEREPAQWMAGSNGFTRWQSFAGKIEEQALTKPIHVAIVYHADGKIEAYRNGQPYGKPYQSEGPVSFAAGETQVLLGMRHGIKAAGNRMLAGRIEQAHLYDKALSAEEIEGSARQLKRFLRAELLTRLSDEQQASLTKWEAEQRELTKTIQKLNSHRVYAVQPRSPGKTHLLLRGNPGTPAEEVVPAGIESLQGVPADFELSGEASDADRREKLAEWITSAENPLFARVIVNRIWHYHFGQGIVASPNDFGFNGIRPTHPALLDYLARYLIEHDWSLKAVHRLILTSETYQQSSRPVPAAMQVDAGNRWLWRFAPQRLEAEVIRDTMLKVSGEMNWKSGGPSYRNFKMRIHNSTFYEMQDRTEPEFQRRTIYRMWIRSGRNALLDALDCPDPSVTTPARTVTVTPTQSLSLLNNSFVLRMADRLSERITKAGHTESVAQVDAAYELLLQRKPLENERSVAGPFVEQHGLAAFARILFNTNEFLFAE